MRGLVKLCFFVVLLLVFISCQNQEKSLKVAATPIPHAELLEQVRPELKKEGINLQIVEVDDYGIPNRLLAEKQVDANFFQHYPFLEAERKAKGYELSILAKVHLEPLGLYSTKHTSLEALPEHAVVAIPSDPTNEMRALLLLQALELLTLKEKRAELVTLLDIESNPKKLKIEELDAALLPRALQDVDVAIIPANWALQSKLAVNDALVLEKPDHQYANILVVRSKDLDRFEMKRLAEWMNSEKIRLFLEEKYKKNLMPAF